MTGRIRTASLLALLCAVATCGRIAAQAPISPTSSPLRPGYEPVQMQRGAEPASQSAPIHIAVVGAVRNPAVYRTQRPRTFVELIDAAGGPDSDASSSVQIVRQGRIDRLIYDPRTPVAEKYGPLLDGDVVILRPQPGVRNAMYQTTTATDAAGRRTAAVQHAMQPRLVYVACIGLLNRPVVLPLNPDEATLPILLPQMLQLTGPATAGVRIVANAAQLQVDGLLANGTVLEFDRRVIGPRDIQPVQEYPPARDIDESQATPPPSEQKPLIDTPPAVPRSSRSINAGEMSFTPPMAPPGGAPRREALQVPGLPFIVRDEPRSSSSVWASDAAVSVPPVVRPVDDEPASSSLPGRTSQPIDVTDHSISPRTGRENFTPRPVTTAHLPAAGISGDTAAPAGIRLPLAASQAGPVSNTAGSELQAANAAAHGSLSTGQWVTAICGSLLASVLAGLAGWLWWLEVQNARSTPALATTLPMPRPSVEVSPITPERPGVRIAAASEYAAPTSVRTVVPQESPPVVASSVQDLIDRRLPIHEETALSPAEVRLYGRTVGTRQLRWDPPQPVVAAPHFAARAQSATASVVVRLEQRLERIIEAARTAEASPTKEPVGSASAPIRSTASAQPFLYDIVQPVTDAAADDLGRREVRGSQSTRNVRTRTNEEVS